jgi:thiol-disulfide isomerase/thioredoxin
MNGIRRWFVAAALVVAAIPFAHAGDDAAAKELAALEKKFDGEKGAKKDLYAAYKPQFEKFAKAHAGSDAGLDAKLWLLQNTWWLKDDKGSMQDAAAKIADEILAEYGSSEHVAPMADYSYVFRPEKFAEVLATLSAPEKPKTVRAAATLANAVRLSRAGQKDKAAPVFEELAKQYGDLAKGYTTYGELADAYRNPHAAKDLEVGKAAPEIVGRSPDGKAMKLSDYKGRVVVVDFFGDW